MNKVVILILLSVSMTGCGGMGFKQILLQSFLDASRQIAYRDCVDSYGPPPGRAFTLGNVLHSAFRPSEVEIAERCLQEARSRFSGF